MEVLQTISEAISPVWNRKAEGLLELGFIKDSISRTFDRAGKLRGVTGLNVAIGMPCLSGYLACEVEP